MSEPPDERPERFEREPPSAWWAPLISEPAEDDAAPTEVEVETEGREAQERPGAG